MKNIHPINNDIVFQFEQEYVKVSTGKQESQAFEEVTDWGFSHHNFDETVKHPRWGYITHLGPDVSSELFIGARILIEPLKWTSHVVFEGRKWWKTTEDYVLAYDADVTE